MCFFFFFNLCVFSFPALVFSSVSGVRNCVLLAVLLLVLSLLIIGAVILAIIGTSYQEAPFDVSTFN